MVQNFDAAQIGPFASGSFANSCFVTQQGDAGDAAACTHGCGDDSAWICSLGQHDMLGLGGSALANSFQDVHRSIELARVQVRESS